MENDTNSTSQRDLAYRGLRRLLVLQRLPEGERLREPQWAEELGVNRTALREAFARLEAEGMIEKGERTGYFVPRLTQKDLDEIKHVRLTLECAAIELISADPVLARATAKQLLVLCAEFENFARSRYSLGTSEADRRFHETILDSSGSRRLAMLYHRAPLPLIRGRLTTEQQWAEQCALVASEHRQIAQAIADCDAVTARQILNDHLRSRHQLPVFA